MRDAGIVLNRDSSVPLNRQLETALRDAILSGRMRAGERVLSSRELQTHLGLSRNTIVGALAQLHAEGYLVTVRGVGTFVAETLEHRPRESGSLSTRESEIVPSDRAESFLSARALAANLAAAVPFRPGIPALDLFPAAQFKRGFDALDWTPRLLDYPLAYGDELLREAIVKRLRQTRGVACSADQVLITGGAQATFALIARVLLKANDGVIVEEPGYPNVRAIFLAEGARVLPVGVDEAGIDVAAFASRRAKLVHATPSHQYPTGAVLSLERRFALLEWASKHDAWIVEDDYDSEFNYTGKPQPALYGLGEGRRVLYVGTFSKVLAPAIRVAYVVVPRALRGAFEAAQQVTGAQPSSIVQHALALFIERGHFARHITKMRAIYDERRGAASADLTKVLGAAVRVQDSRAGLHSIVHFPKSVDDARFAARANDCGIVTPALSSYFHGRPWLNGVVVGYAATAGPDAKRAIATLGGIFEAQ
jgi:GntR family transcriptional regulator / MocR family aminotransferase